MQSQTQLPIEVPLLVSQHTRLDLVSFHLQIKTIIVLKTQFCSINLHLKERAEPEAYVSICKVSLVTLIYDVTIIIYTETNIRS